MGYSRRITRSYIVCYRESSADLHSSYAHDGAFGLKHTLDDEDVMQVNMRMAVSG
jgi:hypothetical protein